LLKIGTAVFASPGNGGREGDENNQDKNLLGVTEMKIENDKVAGLKIAYIGGGSKGWAWKLMRDLALEEQLSGSVYLYDIDYQAALNNEMIGNKFTKLKDAKSKWKYKAVKTIREALTGADFTILSILPGTLKEMASDVHAPEKYGIYQSVGDTVGPGGLMRALRTVPMYVEIAESIKKYAPDTWVINYTNPMTVCTRTLYKVFPGIKAFGCCHEVFSVQRLLAEMLNQSAGFKNVKREDIKVNVLGINHFTWISKASYKSLDLFPFYKKFVDEYYVNGFTGDVPAEKQHTTHRVKFDLFKRYGLIAAAGDRHLAEFLPPWYLRDPETVKEWGFRLSPVSGRVKHKAEKTEKSKKLISGEETPVLKASNEEGVRQMKALLGFGDLVTNVNLPNCGQLKGFPEGPVVETNALFTRDRIDPVFAGALPQDVQSLVMRQVLNQEIVVQAALTGDKALAFKAFITDPLVAIDLRQAQELFETMLENTAEYLPWYKKQG